MSKTKVIEVFERTQMIMQIGTDTKDRVTTVAVSADDLKELNSDYINEHYGCLQDEAYQRGLHEGNDIGYKDGVNDGRNEAWEAARKIVLSPDEGGTSLPTLFAIFGGGSMQHVFRKNSAAEAIEKLKAYEEKQKADEKIKVGDEVRAEDGTAVFVVTWMSENCICGVDREGKCYSYEPREVCGKTGKKYSVGISDITRCTDDED